MIEDEDDDEKEKNSSGASLFWGYFLINPISLNQVMVSRRVSSKGLKVRPSSFLALVLS